MKCQICKTDLVQSNINYGSDEEEFHTQYFCFGCGLMYSCRSDSGDFVEENLDMMGYVDNW